MNSQRLLGIVLVSLMTVACTGPAHAGFIGHLKVAGIDGESTAIGFESWSDIFSYSISAQNTGSSGSGGATGRATLSDMTLRKRVDKASPKLFGAVLTGMHFPTATVELTRLGDQPQKFASWLFEDVQLSSYSTSASTEEALDTISINFAKVTYNYWPQNADGSAGAPVVFAYDRRTNASSLTGPGNLDDFQFVTSFGTEVPEPNSVWLLLVGLTLSGTTALRGKSR